MFNTAFNILGANEDKKREFISTFSKQTTEIDKKLGEIFTTNNNRQFGTAFITLIRLALSHAYDDTAEIHKQLENIINPPSLHVNTNNSFSSPTIINSPPLSPIPNLEPQNNKPNLEITQIPQQNIPKLDSPNRTVPTPPKTPQPPKRVNNPEISRPIKNINKSVNPTNQNRSTPQLTTDSRDLMEIDPLT